MSVESPFFLINLSQPFYIDHLQNVVQFSSKNLLIFIYDISAVLFPGPHLVSSVDV